MNAPKFLTFRNYSSNDIKFFIITLYILSLVLFGFLMGNPKEILTGLHDILIQPDTLITDYIGIGGIGAAFVNSGTLTLIFIYIIYKLKLHFNGLTIASLFLIAGFALFGKNLFNIWFVVFGVYLYSLYQKESFSKYIYVALFGTSMSPMVTEIMFTSSLQSNIRVPLGILVGIGIGFILPTLSTYLLKVHNGFNLYNVGFVAGIIGTILVSLLKSYGFSPNPRLIWTSGNNTILSIYLYIMFFSMILIGFLLNNKSFNGVKNITKYSGRLITDFTLLEGFNPTLINMGINGILSTTYILIVNGDLNGPTIAGILTIVGFSALGKHPKNILPIFLGVFLGSLTKTWNLNDPSILLAALFGTALAPIAGEFGWKYGVLAGFIHSSVVLNVGVLHGGLNLYNNGFSAGIVAAILVPLIEAFKKENI